MADAIAGYTLLYAVVEDPINPSFVMFCCEVSPNRRQPDVCSSVLPVCQRIYLNPGTLK